MCQLKSRDGHMSEIKVECYAGHRADQRPVRFTIGEQIFRVEDIEDQWYSPSAIYFRVLASDGNMYVLRHDEAVDRWSIEAFRALR
jgi:hypothetical protein